MISKPLKPGMKLDRYLIVQEIGTGGMGSVWKAIDETLNRTVAIKALHNRHREDAKIVRRFKREPMAMSRFNHPNIAQIIMLEEREDVLYFVMEYIDGKKLSDIITEDFRLPVHKVLDVFRQVATALTEIHKKGIIHRDIKPDNIMIDASGRAVLMDFGLSKIDTWSATFTNAVDPLAALREFDAQESSHKELVGTPAYLAPERWLGREYDHRIDIYSFGAMMFHALTGETPFGEEPDHNLMTAHVKGRLPKISRLAGPVPEMVEGIVERCMAKDPEDRFRTAEDLHRALHFTDRDIEVSRSRLQKKLDDIRMPEVHSTDFELLHMIIRIIGVVLLVGLLGFALFVLPLMIARTKIKLDEKNKTKKNKKPSACLQIEIAGAGDFMMFEKKEIFENIRDFSIKL